MYILHQNRREYLLFFICKLKEKLYGIQSKTLEVLLFYEKIKKLGYIECM